ncbi:hypothetical protein BST85_12300 [Aureitalea marina]|uniref:Uncharacterized protein n=1 Tax=Aureitalea marina TaxID=930804 RepID=A0A2S7KSJ1_9FLAO|nr:hypothetical protein BST85_12300 [Aureitalea marina]
MNKFPLLISLLIAGTIYSQGCTLELDELVKSRKFNQFQFESFAVERGFVYNAISRTYFCETANYSDNVELK